MPILHECHGMSTEEAMMEPRHVMADEKMIPANGDHGGPLCCIVAKYEDGTQISFGHEVMNKYVPADLADALVVAAEKAVSVAEITGGKVGIHVVRELRAALAAYRDED